MSFLPVYTIAQLTLFEMLRKRLILAVGILTLVLMAITTWGFSRVIKSTNSDGTPIPHVEMLITTVILVILVSYMFSMILTVGAAFLAAPTIAGDIKSGLALAILPRPIRRLEIVLGKWLGLAALLAVYTSFTAGGEFYLIDLVTGYAPPHPILTIVFIIAQSLVVLTVGLVASTRLSPITGGIVAVVLFGFAWIAGIAATIGAAVNNIPIQTSGTVISLLLPTDGLWRGAIYNMEPAILLGLTGAFARGNPFYVGAPPTTPYIIWSICWVLVVLGAAIRNFRRRDI